MSTSIRPPDDELNERWKAAHEHPELRQIEHFDDPHLVEILHANDATTHASVENDDAPQSTQAVSGDGQAPLDEADPGDDGLLEPGPHEHEEEAAGHDMIVEEYRNWMTHPRVADEEDYSL